MTTRADYHTETAKEFLARAHTYLADGDLPQASEKGWGATARMVKAVAETRGWRHSAHGDLYRAVNRLADEIVRRNATESLSLRQRAAPELL